MASYSRNNKMHRGTDFAAPAGTPIMALTDSGLLFAISRWCGGGERGDFKT